MDYGFDWAFFIYMVLYSAVCGRVAIWTYHFQNNYRDKKFLKHLKIENPDSTITLSSVESSDWQALNEIKEELDRR